MSNLQGRVLSILSINITTPVRAGFQLLSLQQSFESEIPKKVELVKNETFYCDNHRFGQA